jgi:chemotaxis protein methyltransferase CheR
MTTVTPLTQDQLARLGEVLSTRCGLRIGDANHPFVQEGVARLMARTGAGSFEEFFSRATDASSGLRDQLVNAMLSRETAWFRAPECLHAITRDVLPELQQDLACGRGDRIRIWSAGCSTGQEPYSLVMEILASLGERGVGTPLPEHFEIVGSDVSPAAIFLAVAGRYERSALDGRLPQGYLARFFEDQGRVCAVRDQVLRSVRFRQRNLLDPPDDLAGGAFHVVVLSHVLEYYTPPSQHEILRHVHSATAPGGVLLLGSQETLPDEELFGQASLGACRCFRRR